MFQAIEGRELVTLDGHGVLLRGTFHRPQAQGPDAEPDSAIRNRVGLVLLNSLSLPRAAAGDSAVYWADSFASCGYPTFRFDLPGLGDTAGSIPTELLNFINEGGYGSVGSAKVKELVERFGLSGVILFGHCAGAVSAIYAAAANREECKGLILLDPYFHLPQAVRPKLRQRLSDWALQSRIGAVVSNIYDRIRDISLVLRGDALPGNANSSLLSCWKGLASTGLPILLLKAPGRKAPGTKPRVGEFDYLKHVLQIAGRKSQVVVELIETADHSFANRAGRASVRRHTERWLNDSFPLTKQGEVGVNVLCTDTDNKKGYAKYQLDCLHG